MTVLFSENGNGRSAGRRTPRIQRETSNASSAASAPVDSTDKTGESTFQNLMNIASYEVHQDPYRGLQSHRQSQETGTTITTPWHACEWGRLPSTAVEDWDDFSSPEIMLRHLGQCSCPSINEWTRLAILEKNKKTKAKSKRKRGSASEDNKDASPQPEFCIGLRPNEPGYVCPCDFNPLCIATLGGFMNELLEERCEDLNKQLRQNQDRLAANPASPNPKRPKTIKDYCSATKKSPRNGDQEVLIIDDDEMEPKKETTQQDDDSDNTFGVPDENISSSPNKNDVSMGDNSTNEPILTPRKLSPGAQLVWEEDPARIFTKDMPPENLADIQFSAETRKKLRSLRKPIHVRMAPIRSYIEKVLQQSPESSDREKKLTVEEYIQALRDWHQKLQFSNPLGEEMIEPDDHISVTLPPGIDNLGATCYLNTQLQCLAQNLTFLNGIFSWRMVDTTHNMNAVMTRLQKLLAEMTIGGSSTLTTLEFSNALGLEHFEQQDPNEFARLLFDRMDESFQQCDNGGDLSNLLKRIFHGVTMYKTICMTCNTTSERREGFMDLNLPIVKRPNEKKTNGTIVEAFAAANNKNVDTDVQFCLDQYLYPELLDGDNQYFCGHCNCKRDAKRILELEELPPVLNVQLSRYVFDRVKFMKKKVSDKVLLPSSLTVKQSSGEEKKYLLCAVMKHLGNSAYSGHYLAEAMDWLTGTWFEFNDDLVRHLPKGPSCSFDPTIPLDEGELKPAGSQDAYNMYYVEEQYLSKVSTGTIIGRKSTKVAPVAGVLDDVVRERSTAYSKLSDMCISDNKVSDRLRRRKSGIRKYLFNGAQSLIPRSDENINGMWVNTEFLVKYLRCNPNSALDSRLRDRTQPVLQQRPFLCEHNLLSPRAARQGKLIGKSTYKNLISLIRGEQRFLAGESAGDNDLNFELVADCDISLQRDLLCAICAKAHRECLSAKLEYLQSAKSLCEALTEQKKEQSALYYKDGDDPLSDEDAFAFVSSKQSASRYRKKFSALTKSFCQYINGGFVGERDLSSDFPSIYEGIESIDHLNLCVGGRQAKEKKEEESNSSKAPADDQEKLDPVFNTNITCSHGNCNITNTRQIRFLRQSQWLNLKKLFPKAIEHKRRRILKSSGKDESNDGGCSQCREEKASERNLRETLLEWGRKTKKLPLYYTQLSVSNEEGVSNIVSSAGHCRLVMKEDIETWRKAGRSLAIASKLKGYDMDGIREFAETLAFPTTHKVILDFEKEPVDRLIGSIKSFVCTEHHRFLQTAFLQQKTARTADGTSSHSVLSQQVTVVRPDEYKVYLDSLADLLDILDPASKAVDERNTEDFNRFKSMIFDAASSHHPLIRAWDEDNEQSMNSKIQLQVDESEETFLLCPGFCEHHGCEKDFIQDKDQKPTGNGHIENVSMDSADPKPNVSKGPPIALGTLAAAAILVESDLEEEKPNTFPLRIFEAEEGASQDNMLKSLQTASVTAPDQTNDINSLRRSSRKRKVSYPCGVLLQEESVEIGLHHNVAALRLLMFEKCSISLTARKLWLVICAEGSLPVISVIEASKATSTLNELVDGMVKDKETSDLDARNSVFVIHARDRSSGSKDLTDGEGMMDSLLASSNLDGSSKSKASSTKAKKARPSERGFRGTLLHGGVAVPKASESSAKSSEDQNAGLSTVSDEEKEAEKPACIVESPKNPALLSSSNESQGSLSGSDDEKIENLLARGPTFKKQKKNAAGESASDNSPSNAPSKGPPVIPISADLYEEEPPIPSSDSASRDALLLQISQMLLKIAPEIVPEPVEESKVWDAAIWALEQNQEETNPERLVDSAFAKYLSGDDSNEVEVVEGPPKRK